MQSSPDSNAVETTNGGDGSERSGERTCVYFSYMYFHYELKGIISCPQPQGKYQDNRWELFRVMKQLKKIKRIITKSISNTIYCQLLLLQRERKQTINRDRKNLAHDLIH